MRTFAGIIFLGICSLQLKAQFPPPAGQPGSTAIYKDSSVFIAWASGCTITRGYQDITDTTLGYASVGDSSMATGKAGTNGVVSLGDGGEAILSFDQAISNGPGWDFAVFENSFRDDFLELAFVEVSSDGVNFFRFPASSFTQDSLQVDAFGLMDATKIDNLAGKYRGQYGTPFDLEQLSGQEGLNINAITHVKVIDVVGSILDQYASYDQYGNKINDPWTTPFASSGFDLDAVGVMAQGPMSAYQASEAQTVKVYPNPAKQSLHIKLPQNINPQSLSLSNAVGQPLAIKVEPLAANQLSIDVTSLPEGLYFVHLNTASGRRHTQRVVVRHE